MQRKLSFSLTTHTLTSPHSRLFHHSTSHSSLKYQPINTIKSLCNNYILKQLQKNEEKEVDVTWEDQAMINCFGRLNARMHELEAEKRIKEEDINNLQDASNELILAEDEDELIYFSLGESFVGQEKSQVEELLEQKEDSIKQEIEHITNEIQEIKQTLAGLKVKLYAKFSTSINLEED